MADTTFSAGTPIVSAWLNDVNDFVYGNTPQSADKVNFLAFGTGAVSRTVQNTLRDSVSVKDFGATGDGTTDDTTAINNALTAAKRVYFPAGVYKVTSALTLLAQRQLVGDGCSSESNVRGATCILRAFTGSTATVTITGEDVLIQGIDFDNDSQGTGPCIRVKGSRPKLLSISCRESGSVGTYVGEAEAGALSFNANLGRLDDYHASNNASHGILFNHTNTTTFPNFPAGLPNVNSWTITHLDCRVNGGDGVRFENCIDNAVLNLVAQENIGYGARFNQYARGHRLFGSYTELNTAGDMLLEAGANNNMILGNRSATLSSGYVNNGSGNYILEWRDDIEDDGWTAGKDLNIFNAASGGLAIQNFYTDTNIIRAAYLEARQTTGSGGGLRIYTKRNGNTPVSRLEFDDAGNINTTANSTLKLGSSSGPGFYSGTGTPEGAVTAVMGSIFLRTDGAASTTLYVKTTGTGNTGWTAK